MFRQIFAVSVLAMSVASSASAFEFRNSSVTLGDEFFTYPGGMTENSKSLSARTELSFNPSFGIALGANYHDLSNYVTENYFTLQIAPYYDVSDSTRISVFVERNTVMGDDGSLFGEGTYYGVEGRHSFANGLTLSGYAGGGRHFWGNDATIYGVDAQYSFNNGLDLGAYYHAENLDSNVVYSRYGLTVGYMVSGDSLPFDMYVAGYIGRFDIGSSTYDTIGLSLTVPVGHGDGRQPLRPSVVTHSPVFEYYW